ncbi:hypothetical protein [Streptomyces profundus]|uniref:hypothetical protein n=1 Tax=Streptomyces profundus TaxID=2867410 RepID=UPI001D166CF3|nr:hypothetical protein [Streptomyces sp. MA3_2.13]UED85160.1 hypothetical protein K4G22_13930 [Streptomyces sp. MA3_2.13]
MTARAGPWTTRLLVIIALTLGTVVPLGAREAAADHCEFNWEENNGGSGGLDYGDCTHEEGSGGGSGSGGDGGEPSCDVSLAGGYGDSQWCEDDYACWANIPSAAYPPEQWPSDPPEENSVYIYKYCVNAAGEFYDAWDWHTPEGPSLWELATQAYGQLNLPGFELTFNPPDEAIVNLATWWWAAGAADGEVRGTPAGSVVAIAEPNRMELDPGDGSATLNCPLVASRSGRCAHTYTRASVNGGAEAPDGGPAYPARAQLVYDVRFENNGAPLNLPGLPDSLTTPWAQTPVPVTEVQASVVD